MEEAVLPSVQATQSNKRFKRFALALIGIGVILLIIFGIFRFLRGSAKKSPVTPTPTQFQFPSKTPSPSISLTPSVSPTKSSATPTQASSVDKATGLDRANLSVSVENGSGTVGAGSKAADYLKSLGYHVVAIGNADNFNFQDVTVQVKSTKAAYLPLLKKDLSANYTVGSAISDLSASSSANAVVIIGK